MAPSFQVGDIVRLRSGGRPMTVAEVVVGNHVICIWSDEKEHLQRMNFVIATLEIDD